MGLFNKKKPVAPPPAPKPLAEKHFVRAANFRGFKRFRVTVHGIEAAERNAEILKDVDLKGADIFFKVFKNQYGAEYADAYINGLLVGVVYDEDEVFAIRNNLFDKVYAMYETETVLGAKKTITRPRVRFFVSYVTEGKQL